MRVGVYNEFWHTGGGGEAFCGGVAQVLADEGHDVTLLAARPFDPDPLGERLAVDLRRCLVQVVKGGPSDVSTASGQFELFVNGSYLSPVRNQAAASIYIVHFPGQPPEHRRSSSFLDPWLARFVRPPVHYDWGEGFHATDPGASGSTWTSDRAELVLDMSGIEDPLEIELLFGHLRAPVAGPAHVRILVDGQLATELDVPASTPGLTARVLGRLGTSAKVTVQPTAKTSSVVIESDTFVPAELGLGSDVRELGVPLRYVGGGTLPSRLLAIAAPRLHDRVVGRRSLGAPRGYDVVASNSEFTRRFVEEWWGIDRSPVLYPPVILRPRSQDKQRSIVAVGRFFERSSGHSKKQLELVRAFRRLRATGVDGWTLRFVGGCDDSARRYLDLVRAEADGLPVEFLIDASGAERDAAIRDAAIFWHATGLDEDPLRSPDRFEHFGISTVEAMSTRAVPVVFAGGGQLEIVEDGRSGYLFRHLDELVDLTRALIEDPDLLDQMGDAAADRSEHFGMDRFRSRLLDVVAEAMDGGAS